jgi:hypothetical protein
VGRDCIGSGVRATRAAVATFGVTERGSGAAHKEECGTPSNMVKEDILDKI